MSYAYQGEENRILMTFCNVGVCTVFKETFPPQACTTYRNLNFLATFSAIDAASGVEVKKDSTDTRPVDVSLNLSNSLDL